MIKNVTVDVLKKRGMTRYQLADMLVDNGRYANRGSARGAVYRFCNGKGVNLGLLGCICGVLDVEPGDLLKVERLEYENPQ